MRVLLFAILFIPFISVAQGVDTIYVGFNKPVLLVFDKEAKAKFGSPDIEVEHAGNQIFVTVIKEFFEETNLFVKSNGRYHVFIVRYAENPDKLLYNYQEKFRRIERIKQQKAKGIPSSSPQTTDRELIDYARIEEQIADSLKKDSIASVHDENCNKINSKPQEIFDRAISKHKMLFLLSNMYVNNGHFYLKMGIQNESDVDYHVNFVKFEIRNSGKRISNTSVQKIVKEPVYIYEKADTITAKSFRTPIYVFKEFVLDKNRMVHIEIWEKKGDRILEFNLTHKDILSIKELR